METEGNRWRNKWSDTCRYKILSPHTSQFPTELGVSGHLKARMGQQETEHILKTVSNVLSNNLYLLMLLLPNLRIEREKE